MADKSEDELNDQLEQRFREFNAKFDTPEHRARMAQIEATLGEKLRRTMRADARACGSRGNGSKRRIC